MNEFSESRELLAKIRIALGSRGIVGIAWDGDLLKVSHAIPESGKQMVVAHFDGPDDYSTDAGAIISEIAKMSEARFGERIAPPENEENAA